MAFLVLGDADNGYAKGAPPSGPTSARYPFSDNLRTSRFAKVYRLVETEPKQVVVGDIVVMKHSDGSLMQVGGEKIAYVTETSEQPDGSVGLSVLPYQERMSFSNSDVPPYVPVAIDRERMRTFHIELEESEERLKKVTVLEQTELDTDYLYPSKDRFMLVDSDGEMLDVPYQILRHFVKDGMDMVTVLCTEQDAWTLHHAVSDGTLHMLMA